VLVLEECSLELPPGELSLDDDELCSLVVVAGTTTAGAATTIGGGGAGATTTGGAYTTAGPGAEVVVWLEVVVSEVCANPMATLPNSTATPKDKAAVLSVCFIIISPLVLLLTVSFQRRAGLIASARTSRAADCSLSARENAQRRYLDACGREGSNQVRFGRLA
jgi:hypothetical protein